MGDYNIFRPLDKSERNGVIELGSTKNLLNLFLKDVANKQQEMQKKYLPFDSYSARIDFDEKVKSKMNEMSVTVDASSVNSKIEFGDFEEYCLPERFTYLGKAVIQQTRLVAGIKQEVDTGVRYRFKAKPRGNKISIAVPNEDVAKMDKYIEEKYGAKPEVKESKK